MRSLEQLRKFQPRIPTEVLTLLENSDDIVLVSNILRLLTTIPFTREDAILANQGLEILKAQAEHRTQVDPDDTAVFNVIQDNQLFQAAEAADDQELRDRVTLKVWAKMFGMQRDDPELLTIVAKFRKHLDILIDDAFIEVTSYEGDNKYFALLNALKDADIPSVINAISSRSEQEQRAVMTYMFCAMSCHLGYTNSSQYLQFKPLALTTLANLPTSQTVNITLKMYMKG